MQLSDVPRGVIIMIDGPDGVGKSTEIKLLQKDLAAQGYTVFATRAHGGTPIGEKLREVSLSDTPRTPFTDLHISRAIHAELAKELHERRAKGEICVVDRSPASMWSYQVRAGGLPEKYARPIIKDDFTMLAADLVLVLVASLDVLHQRQGNREIKQDDFFENQPEAYHEWTIIGYTETAKEFGTTLVDASGSADDVHHKVLELVNPLLPQPPAEN